MKPQDTWYRISVFFKDKDKKNFFVLIKEVLTLWVIKKRFPIHYFGRFLYRKNAGPYKEFLDMKEYYTIIYSKELNSQDYIPLIDNKLVFSLVCEKFNIPSPRVLGYNFKNDFFYDGKVQRITGNEQLAAYFENLFATIGSDKLFIKSLGGFGGRETHLLERTAIEDTLKQLGSTFLDQAGIHQVGIDQHPDINQIYPDSVNTIRFETYIDKTNKPHFLGTFIRFGTGGSAIDNVSSGGFFVAVDTDTGILSEKAMQGMIFGGKNLSKHPDSGFNFSGFKIPYFEESKSLCLDLLRYIPCRLVGWDIAITPTGPVVIEGNGSPGILMGEIGYGGYVKHPIYEEIIAKKAAVI